MTSPTDIHEQIIELLDNSHIKYQVVEHPPVTTVKDALELVPDLSKNLLKTVIFKKEKKTWVFAVTLGHQQIHYKKLATAADCKRTELHLVPGEQITKELGYEIGGVGPFPFSENSHVFIEESINKQGVITCGSGRRDRSLQMELDDLIKVSGAIRKDLIKSIQYRR